jgi:hypothetical protein
VAILASFKVQRIRKLRKEEVEEINDANFEHAVEISHQQAATEEADRLLMTAERQRLLDLNAQCQTDAAAREQVRLVHNKNSRWW